MDINDFIKMAADTGAKAALNYIEKKKKTAHDRRLYNTKLLLRNYNALKKHCDEAICSIKESMPDLNAIDILESIDLLDRQTYIESIERSTVRTQIILTHISKMISLFQAECLRNGHHRKYNVLYQKYILEWDDEKICKANGNIDARTLRRDLLFAHARISAMIFGIDGLPIE